MPLSVAKGKRSKKTQQKEVKTEIEVIVVITISILMAVLVYGKSGVIGASLNTILGGLFSWIMYIIPAGMMVASLYRVMNKKETL